MLIKRRVCATTAGGGLSPVFGNISKNEGQSPVFGNFCLAQHVDVQDAVFVVRGADGGEAEALVELLEARLGADADAVAGVLLFGAADAFGDQLAADARAARNRRRQDAAQ